MEVVYPIALLRCRTFLPAAYFTFKRGRDEEEEEETAEVLFNYIAFSLLTDTSFFVVMVTVSCPHLKSDLINVEEKNTHCFFWLFSVMLVTKMAF